MGRGGALRRRLAALFAAFVVAATSAAPVEFAQLSSDERRLLAGAQSLWPVLPPAERAQLRRNARHWLGLDAAGQAALTRAAAAWDRLPAPERAARRGRLADWSQLDEADRARLRGAATALAALPAARQSALRRQFAALPATEREDWRLGPSLAPQIAPLKPLFAFLPAADQAALLALLRDLPPPAREALGKVAADAGEARRQELRRQLLAAPPAARPALIEKWVAGGG